jgi:hypothetical protein
MKHSRASLLRIRLAADKRMTFSQAAATYFETQLVFVFRVAVPALAFRVAEIT